MQGWCGSWGSDLEGKIRQERRSSEADFLLNDCELIGPELSKGIFTGGLRPQQAESSLCGGLLRYHEEEHRDWTQHLHGDGVRTH